MSTKVKCVKCPQILNVPDDSVRKNVRCPKCGTTFKVEQWLIAATKAALGTGDVANVSDVPERGPSGNFLLAVTVIVVVGAIAGVVVYGML